MKNTKMKALSLITALSLMGFAVGCADSASSAPTLPAGSPEVVIGAAADYDYETFTLDAGLDENGFFSEFNAADCVVLPEGFENLDIPLDEVTPTQEELDAEVKSLLESYTKNESLTEGTAALGDTVNIDYAGAVDGVLFVGGTAENFDLLLGSGKFIPGFEDALVGHDVGETFDIHVTFPEGYNDSADADGNPIVLSGADTVFTVTINAIQVSIVPELTDEWVAETFTETLGVSTTDELVTYLSDTMTLQNANYYVSDYLVSNTEYTVIPDSLVNYNVCQLLQYYSEEADYYYGLDLESYVTGAFGVETVDAFLAAQAESLTYYIQLALAQQAVAQELGLTPTDEILAGFASYTEYYPTNYIAMNALVNTVNEALVSNANIA